MAAASKKQPAAAASTGEPAAAVDPKFEWAEKAGSYVLRLWLPGFRKDDIRVQVDSAGRLTVRSAGPAAAGPGGSLHKVFQLPSAASLDDIAGRFEAGVLTLTVPKRASSAAAAPPPTSIEEIKRNQPSAAKETKPTEEEIAKEEASKKKKKAMDEAQGKKRQEEAKEEAKSRNHEQQKAPAVPVKKEEAEKPSAPQAAATTAPKKPDAPTGTDKAKAVVAPESLAERVRRRGEEERAKAAAKDAKSGQEKQGTACGGGGGSSWKERVQGELKELASMKWAEGLTDMKWADGVVEAARKNKEVVAVGIAAFSLGLLVSHKLFRK